MSNVPQFQPSHNMTVKYATNSKRIKTTDKVSVHISFNQPRLTLILILLLHFNHLNVIEMAVKYECCSRSTFSGSRDAPESPSEWSLSDLTHREPSYSPKSLSYSSADKTAVRSWCHSRIWRLIRAFLVRTLQHNSVLSPAHFPGPSRRD